ncbi:hypothetical protein AMATHDRAFT_137971 [Amanita thiersii Skay4041]|uniref:G-protein coupled receptors family 1 profile domain-containing protein n=1 Tax=Amanita thiersii Skay4041 TaxID=703135 RepID=A0A2A9NTD4_9AGAR|nr:hypothetical protein AMATHDRAFT_137971 [Amanita thiersii Skay4041]
MPNYTTHQIPPPPSGLNYIEAIKPALNLLLIGAIWSAMLLPLLITLFFFSTKELRRKPIFILNVLALLFGEIMGVLNVVHEYHAIVDPLNPLDPSNYVASGIIIIITPFLVQSILVLRLLAVYPLCRTPTRLFISIFLPLALLKIARAINFAIFLKNYVIVVKAVGDAFIAGKYSWNTVNIKIEWILQLVDNSAASFLFLKRLNIRNTLTISKYTASTNGRSSHASKITTLFWIALSNFVFPVILSLIQLIYAFQGAQFLPGTYVQLVNGYVEIIGVLLATVWAAGTRWTLDRNPTEQISVIPPMQFATTPTHSVDNHPSINGPEPIMWDLYENAKKNRRDGNSESSTQ